ncbi:unnamed protein product [Nesidiocoris tenuis]|uniref:UDP-glycosyltransferases domain-containing protein n=1 Tax=Nesidiocoris tenuis TaxID=355587 RepID=A0A6H5HV49_9HEMI|nr:unnamed protein product [Nesidiocoris tenuis]
MELAVGAKILAFLPFPAKSHHIAFQPIIRELANRGHRVDFYTPIKLPNPPKSLKQIMIRDILSDIHGSLNMKQLMTQTIMRNSQTISELCIMVAERLFNEEPKLAELVKSNATYDAVILELHFGQEYQAALIHKFKALGIAVVPLLDSAWVNELAGLPDNPSYMIDFKMVATDKMSFFERLQNLYTWAGTNLVSYYFAMTKQQELADRYIRDYEGWESRPSVLQLSSDVALILSNSHRSLGYAYPKAPHVKEVGGMNLNPPKPLPKDLQSFMDSADYGVIYFSYGSNVDMKQIMSPDKFNAFHDKFKSLKQKVLWKWAGEDRPKVVASNILVQEWFPQQDILEKINQFKPVTTLSAKILAFLPIPWRSHHFVYRSLIGGLAARGHQIDFYTPLPIENGPPNLNQIQVKDRLDDASEYPLASEFSAYLSHKFKAINVAVMGYLDHPWTNEIAGLPDNPSYMISYQAKTNDRMSFSERLFNTYTLVSMIALCYWETMTRQQEFADTFLKYEGWEGRPKLTEAISDVDLILVNTHLSMGYAYPKAPHVKEIGGIHITTKPEPMSKGVQMLLPVAAPGLCLLMGWSDRIKNTKLFITHGGLQSMVETIAYGVPTVGMPVFFDQFKDVKLMTTVGMGLQLNYNNITEDSVYWTINEVLTNPSAVRLERHVLNSSDPLLEGGRARPGQLWLSREKPTPGTADLQEFMDGAPNGVIYFSLGTNLNAKAIMENGLYDVFINTFKRFDRRVMWKANDGMKLYNDHQIKMQTWYPQQDVLGTYEMDLDKSQILIVTILSFLLIALHCSSAAKILAFMPMPWRSHQFIFRPLMRELARKGHQVDFYTPLPMKDPPDSLKQFVVKDWQLEAMEKFDEADYLEEGSAYHAQTVLTDLCLFILEKTFTQDQVVVDLLRSKENYDAVISEYPVGFDGAAYLLHKFKGAKNIVVLGFPDYPWLNELAGLPDNPSYMVSYVNPLPAVKMAFWQRLENFYKTASTILAAYVDLVTKQQKAADRVIRCVIPHRQQYYWQLLEIRTNFERLLTFLTISSDRRVLFSSDVLVLFWNNKNHSCYQDFTFGNPNCHLQASPSPESASSGKCKRPFTFGTLFPEIQNLCNRFSGTRDGSQGRN